MISGMFPKHEPGRRLLTVECRATAGFTRCTSKDHKSGGLGFGEPCLTHLGHERQEVAHTAFPFRRCPVLTTSLWRHSVGYPNSLRVAPRAWVAARGVVSDVLNSRGWGNSADHIGTGP